MSTGGLIRKYTVMEHYPFEFARRGNYTEIGALIEAGSGYAPGKILELADGGNTEVNLSLDGYLMAPGQVFTHTHPNSAPTSLSDVYWLCRAGFGEFRTVGDYFLESMVPGRRLQLEDWYFEIRPTIDRIGTEMGIFHDNYSVDYCEGGYATQSFVNSYDPELERFTRDECRKWHDLWEAVAREYRMEYRVMEW